MGTIFMNIENSKRNEPHKFVLNLSQRLDLRSSNKYAALKNYLFITRKTVQENSVKSINWKQ